MRSPLAPAGSREMIMLTVLLGGGAALCYRWAAHGHSFLWPVAIILTLLWLGGLAFFRDPERSVPSGDDIMVSPADGHVTEITRLDRHDDIGGPALRIGIFLSVFDVHINRSPCSGVVRALRYLPGKFLDARHPDCGQCNESQTIVMDTINGPVVIRQVAGLIARRIVCDAKFGETLQIGQRIGLIKFGSRTELIVPIDQFESAVKIGDKVVGASTIIARRVPNASNRTAQGQLAGKV